MALWTLITTFFGGFSSSTYIILAVCALLSIGAVWFHHNQSVLIENAQEKTALQINNDSQKAALAQAAKDNQKIQVINNDLGNTELSDASQASKLSNTLTKLGDSVSIDINALEIKVNAGSDNRNRCIAIATGSPVAKGEKNPLCPQLTGK